jgi:activator of HSP90 ATPase
MRALPVNSPPITRRDFSKGLAAVLSGLGVAAAGRVAAAEPLAESESISRFAESIHQEVVFNADRHRVYAALTDSGQFDQVVRLSAAMKSGLPPDGAATDIHAVAGGAFTLFLGVISGRNVELVSDQRIVQAWRVAGWPPGVYSIVKFELADQDGGTRLVLDQSGFPAGKAASLAHGWKANYWEPLAKFLG